MSSNKKPNDKDKDIADRISKLISKDNTTKATDEELAQRFTNVFSSAPIATQDKINYNIPDNVYSDDIDKEIERMLQESDDEDDAIDSYIYDILKTSVEKDGQHDPGITEKLGSFQTAFVGSDSQFDTDESDALIKRAQQENALDAKYESYKAKRDDDIEKRYLDLKKDAPNFDNYTKPANTSKPKGFVPKALSTDDFHDEMDDWCCICNDDATIECEGCDDDNKYCSDCYYHTHRSESADYEATKHKFKPYKKFSK